MAVEGRDASEPAHPEVPTDAHEAPEEPGAPAIGRYRVIRRVGEGGMAETFLCRLEGLGRFSKRVMVKALKPSAMGEEEVRMFLDEARVGARLEHASIPRVFEIDEQGSIPYFVTEYVDGPTLQQIHVRQKKTGRRNPLFAAFVAARVAQALDYAHHLETDDGGTLGLIHRDVSLGNVMLRTRGTPMLIDFGIAKYADAEARTQADLIKGKLAFMSPEQLLGQPLSHRSDLFSVGVVLYTLATGKRPFDSEHVLKALVDFDLPPPSDVDPEIPAELETLILRAMAREPADRFARGDDLARALLAWAQSASDEPVDDGLVAAWIDTLFPEGRRGWEQHAAVDLHGSILSRADLPRPAAPEDDPSPGAGAAAPARTGPLLGAIAAVLLLGLMAAAVAVMRPDPAVVAAESSLVEAAARVEAGRFTSAAQLLDGVEARVLPADLRLRWADLREVARVGTARQAVQAHLASGDLDAAVRQATALAASDPTDPTLAALRQEAEAARDQAEADAVAAAEAEALAAAREAEAAREEAALARRAMASAQRAAAAARRQAAAAEAARRAAPALPAEATAATETPAAARPLLDPF